jgi:hypothetical protein
MRSRCSALFFLSLGVGLSGCYLGVDPTADGPRRPRNVAPTPGGGFDGGRLEGELTVFVLDHADAPVAGATVLLDAGELKLSVITDAKGRADFFDRRLRGSVDVHAFARDQEWSSLYGFDASVVTFSLDPLSSAEELADFGTVTGTVGGLSQLPLPSDRVARVATVVPVGRALVEAEQPPRPGTVTPSSPDGSPSNVVVFGESPFPMWTDYSLRADTRATSLAVFGGTFILGDPPMLLMSHVGVKSGLEVGASEIVGGRSVTISHELKREVTVMASGAPALPVGEAFLGVELSDGGVVPLADRPLFAGTASARGPTLDGAFAKARYLVGVRFSSEAQVGDEPETTVYATLSGPTPSFAFRDLLVPVGRPSAAGRALAATPSRGAGVHLFRLTNETTGEELWEVMVRGDRLRSITLPPAPLGHADRLLGKLRLTVTALDVGAVDVGTIGFVELERRVRSGSTSRADVEL